MFNVNGVEVWFAHSKSEDFPNPHFVEKVSHVTTCIVSGEEEDTPYGIAQAVCSREDNFNKAFGRKLSLTRALEDTEFPKEIRKAIWETYWDMVKK